MEEITISRFFRQLGPIVIAILGGLCSSHAAEPGHEKPAGRGRRENLSIKLSRDDGRTWPVNKTLDPGPGAYSDLAVLPEGTVLCLYEGKSDIQVARFNLEWLTTH